MKKRKQAKSKLSVLKNNLVSVLGIAIVALLVGATVYTAGSNLFSVQNIENAIFNVTGDEMGSGLQLGSAAFPDCADATNLDSDCPTSAGDFYVAGGIEVDGGTFLDATTTMLGSLSINSDGGSTDTFAFTGSDGNTLFLIDSLLDGSAPGSVAIGTTVPSSTFHVAVTSTFSGGDFTYNSNSADSLFFIDFDGDVIGFGTSTPSQGLVHFVDNPEGTNVTTTIALGSPANGIAQGSLCLWDGASNSWFSLFPSSTGIGDPELIFVTSTVANGCAEAAVE